MKEFKEIHEYFLSEGRFSSNRLCFDVCDCTGAASLQVCCCLLLFVLFSCVCNSVLNVVDKPCDRPAPPLALCWAATE